METALVTLCYKMSQCARKIHNNPRLRGVITFEKLCICMYEWNN